MYTNARIVPRVCGFAVGVSPQKRATSAMRFNAPWVLYSQHGLQLKSCVCVRFQCSKSQVDECPSGLRSTPRKRVRVNSSASSNLASSAE